MRLDREGLTGVGGFLRERPSVLPGIRDMHPDDFPQGPAAGLVFIPVEGRRSSLIGYLLMATGCGDALVFDPPRGAAELILALVEEHGVRLGQVM